MNLRIFSAWFCLVFLLTGCSTTITNLTPRQMPRNANNLYPFEVEFETTQRSIRENTIQASVVVADQIYPMKRTPMLRNRFETVVPIPRGTNYLNYHYKFDYLYDRIPTPGKSSRKSPPYQLEIVD